MMCVTMILNAQMTNAHHSDQQQTIKDAFTSQFTNVAVMNTLVQWIFAHLLPVILLTDAFMRLRTPCVTTEFVALSIPAFQRIQPAQMDVYSLSMTKTVKITMFAQTIFAERKVALLNQTLQCAMIMMNALVLNLNLIVVVALNASLVPLCVLQATLPFISKMEQKQEV